MDHPPAANNASRQGLIHLWPWLVVLLVVLFIGFIRFRVLDMPLERDEGEYAYAGQLILQGIPPYELAYNMKLPGTYYAYAIGMAIFGETAAGVHWTLIAANSLTIIFVFLLARKLLGTAGALVSCASYGLMSASPPLLGLAAHATHFVVLFAVPATLLLLSAVEKRSNHFLFLSGFLYGLAFLMIQQGVCFIVFGGCFLLWSGIKSRTAWTRDFLRGGLVFAAGVFLPFAVFCLDCYISGDFDRFWFWTFTYAKWYASVLPLREGVQLFNEHLTQTFYSSIGFQVLSLAGLVLAAFNQSLRRPAMFLVGFWLFSFCGTAVGFYFRGHYFILVLPAFAMMTGLAVVALQQALRFPILKDVFQSLPLILYALLFSWAVTYQSQFFFELSPSQIVRSIYQGNPFEETVAVGNYLRDHSAPEAQVAVIGSEPEIYFYARRHSATGYIYTYALMERQPAALAMQHLMIQEIETNRPEFLVRVTSSLSWLANPKSSHLILDWAGQYAARFYDQIGVVRQINGQVNSVWGAEAENANTNGDCLIVYQRKPGAG